MREPFYMPDEYDPNWSDIQKDHYLRSEIDRLEGELSDLRLMLAKVNKPKHLDAKQILADLDAREKARRRQPAPKSLSEKQERELVDQIWGEPL